MGMKNESGEGYLLGKVATNPSIRLVLFVQRIKGCLVHSSINRKVFQKVVYVRVAPRMSTILFV
jgi:phage-related holin